MSNATAADVILSVLGIRVDEAMAERLEAEFSARERSRNGRHAAAVRHRRENRESLVWMLLDQHVAAGNAPLHSFDSLVFDVRANIQQRGFVRRKGRPSTLCNATAARYVNSYLAANPDNAPALLTDDAREMHARFQRRGQIGKDARNLQKRASPNMV